MDSSRLDSGFVHDCIFRSHDALLNDPSTLKDPVHLAEPSLIRSKFSRVCPTCRSRVSQRWRPPGPRGIGMTGRGDFHTSWWAEGRCVTALVGKVKTFGPFKSLRANGGGGGSRTPVREALRLEAYMLISFAFCFRARP